MSRKANAVFSVYSLRPEVVMDFPEALLFFSSPIMLGSYDKQAEF